jgi:hypothetical protein
LRCYGPLQRRVRPAETEEEGVQTDDAVQTIRQGQGLSSEAGPMGAAGARAVLPAAPARQAIKPEYVM